jgi:hypothetical protein
MESPLQLYRKNKKERSDLKKEAYPYFFNKYWKDPFRDVGFLDTTERIKAKSLGFFIPGKIYTFQYNPEYKDILDYYDKRPVILCSGQWTSESTGNVIVTGINFNFLPEIARVNTLEYYYKSVQKDIDEAYKKTSETDQVSFIKRALIVLQDLVQMFNVFNKAGQIGYQFAMRNYIVDAAHMKQVSIVEFDDWEYIPFLQTKDVVGKSLGEIHSLYLKQKGDLAKKQPPILRQSEKRKYNNRTR